MKKPIYTITNTEDTTVRHHSKILQNISTVSLACHKSDKQKICAPINILHHYSGLGRITPSRMNARMLGRRPSSHVTVVTFLCKTKATLKDSKNLLVSVKARLEGLGVRNVGEGCTKGVKESLDTRKKRERSLGELERVGFLKFTAEVDDIVIKTIIVRLNLVALIVGGKLKKLVEHIGGIGGDMSISTCASFGQTKTHESDVSILQERNASKLDDDLGTFTELLGVRQQLLHINHGDRGHGAKEVEAAGVNIRGIPIKGGACLTEQCIKGRSRGGDQHSLFDLKAGEIARDQGLNRLTNLSDPSRGEERQKLLHGRATSRRQYVISLVDWSGHGNGKIGWLTRASTFKSREGVWRHETGWTRKVSE
ncbi:hypothetical protein JR316_0006588 [Psilocybe cubensis]|uniref:Uncharacterized protein n=1 Tax=Psilocybe cubensis TaxID=181762 RepID=A0ACB8GWI9_PSICU|nr:hypothetical protein JR316_0006588 [Psilocybe cubensis]KAH9479991.1 hypothetical protein JR316_0006588 [Psilocybe cubensis]